MMTEEKKFTDLSADEMSNLKIEFAPGCFDNFEGTQEELEEFIAEITRLFKSGEAQKMTRRLDLDDLDEDDFEILEKLYQQDEQGRNLQ